MKLTWMVRKHINEIAVLEEECFGPSGYSREQICNILKSQSAVGIVLETKGKIIGYMVYEFLNRKFALTNIAIAEKHRRKKCGTLLIERLKSKLSLLRRKSISCKVKESDLGTHLFLKSLGFVATKVARNYYTDIQEDAYEFKFSLKENEENEAVTTECTGVS